MLHVQGGRMPAICRDCERIFGRDSRCPNCRSPRIVAHPELLELSIAHMDCDAFYASVEKRDNPELKNKPVIVGGSRRGVVSTACYIARIRGVHSAMPMFKALKVCPDAIVVKPRMNAYSEASRTIRMMMEEMTPAIEPLSLDEAFLDLSGTRRVHGAPPALMLVRLAQRMENEVGVSGSIGLSHNKFLAKIASDLEKPRGFSVIGKQQTIEFLADRPIGLIWGIGGVQQRRLEGIGIRTFRDVHGFGRVRLEEKLGSQGTRLWRLAHGEDARRVSRSRPIKSISNETTLDADTSDPDILDGHIWRLSEKLADRAKAKDRTGRTVVLKLKRHNHRLITRQATLAVPTQMAERIYAQGRQLFERVRDRGPFRLIGVGLNDISPAEAAQAELEFLDPESRNRMRTELASDEIRRKFGKDAILKGRALR